MNLGRHPLLYILIPLLALAVGASYMRFIVLHEYLVSYEGECDPLIHSCFVGCEDEECTSEYYYSLVEKNAVDIERQCGTDITDCSEASMCLSENDTECSITYCDPQIDGDSCESVSEEVETVNEFVS